MSGLFRPLVERGKTLPAYLVEAVFAAGDQWLASLAGNVDLMRTRPELRRRLAATGRAVLAPIVFGPAKGTGWGLPERRTLLAAADPGSDSGWRDGPGATLVKKLRRAPDLGLLRSLVACPFPPLLLRALETAPELTRAEQLRALLCLHTHGGPTELAKALRKPAVRNQLRGGVAELATSAASGPDGLDRLRAAVAELESTPGAIDELYRDPYRAEEILSLRPELDWVALRSAHRTEPFRGKAIDALANRPDCPRELLSELCQHADISDIGDDPNPATDGPVAVSAANRSGSGRFAEEMLHRTRPAVTVLDVAQRDGHFGPATIGRTDGADWALVRAGLAELVATTIGDDPRAWRRLRELLPKTKRTVAELLAEAAANPAVDGAAPDAADCPPPGVTPKRDASRMALLAVLNAASDEVVRALLPYLDDRTAYDLLVLGDWRAEWAAFADPGGPYRERKLLARRPDLPPDLIQTLAELDDPAINAGLFYQRLATWEQRSALLGGVPFGSAAGPLPLDPELRAALLAARTNRSKTQLAPLVGCGDPELVRHFFPNVGLNSQNLQLRLVLGVWERGGREAVVQFDELMPDWDRGDPLPDWFQDKVRDLVGELLAADDPDKALDRLREAVHDEASSKKLARRLRTSGRDLAWLLAEGYRWDWQTLIDEHRRKPFTAQVLAELCALPDRPDELHRALAAMRLAERDNCRPCQRAAQRDQDATGSPRPVTGSDGLVGDDARGLSSYSVHDALFRARRDSRLGQEVRVLVGEHLDGRPDTWVLTLRLLPDFPTSLPDLFATATAVVN